MELAQLSRAAWPGLTDEQIGRVVRFHRLLAQENEVQNLTRLISPQDFVEGHLSDVKELLESGFLEFPAADLGSGGGVPGLLAAVVQPRAWVLIESEQRKAQFLEKSSQALGLSQVRVLVGRGEKVIGALTLGSVVARAVGTVDKIYGWLKKCSTWNSLVLLKGPAWDEEWAVFQGSKDSQGLKLVASHTYTVGSEQKKRIIVKLARVPRGTE